MGMRFTVARIAGAIATWGLHNVFRRPAANFPGKIGLYIDPQLIGDLRARLKEGSVAIAGTNGKTTVTNIVADAFEKAGKTVACNRTGANLDSGMATELLSVRQADWGVLECDELWLAKVLPQLKPRYLVLLNLFRDQLDRMGEIDHIQSSIAQALASSPTTALVYNCDDPLCQAIADDVPNDKIPFGMDEDMHLEQNTVADAGICQRCEAMLEYRWRQYGQLGTYRCPSCGFSRADPAFAGHGVELREAGTSLAVRSASGEMRIRSRLAGTYMAYNLLAACVVATCCGAPPEAVTDALSSFSPRNGRLQRYEIGACRILLNLAKNPTGFNQNLRIVQEGTGPKAVAFFINDKEADGHDVSWLWDVDFQELAREGTLAFAGGIRRNDMQVRLKYAGIDAAFVEGAADFIAQARNMRPDAQLYLIANYTALPRLKAELDRMSSPPARKPRMRTALAEPGDEGKQAHHAAGAAAGHTHVRHGTRGNATDDERRACAHAPSSGNAHRPSQCAPAPSDMPTSPGTNLLHPAPTLTIVHLYPELLNLYGDGGNVGILEKRARWRGIDARCIRVSHGETFDLSRADIVFLGGGPDREQELASRSLIGQADDVRAYVEDDGVMLAICGGYQILGRTWLLGDEEVPGLGVLDIETKRVEGGSHNRLVSDIALRSPLASMPVIGYENHAGRTFLGDGMQPFGHVIGRCGHGNNDRDKADGTLYRNVIGTYLHGPLLAKNPEIADWLIERALARRAAGEGREAGTLAPLDDAAERQANRFMRKRLGIR